MSHEPSRELVLRTGQPTRPTRNVRRLSQLEDRLNRQEKTTKALIQKAFQLKDEMTDRIRPTTMDSALQDLWHEHIRTITTAVKRLNRDIQSLQYEIAARDSQAIDASFQTKSVEHFAQAGVTDLRGRVARCDASIAKLVQDMRSNSNGAELENKRLLQVAEASSKKVDQLEFEISNLTRRLDGVVSQQEGKILTVEGKQETRIEALDSRTKSLFEDVRMAIDSNKKWSETERDRIEHQMTQLLELNSSIVQTKQESFENKIVEKLDSLELAVKECRLETTKCQEEIRMTVDTRSNLAQKINEHRAQVQSELKTLKKEYRDAFESVKQSIDTTNRLVNGKVKLVEEELSREINNIRKMVVLI